MNDTDEVTAQRGAIPLHARLRQGGRRGADRALVRQRNEVCPALPRTQNRATPHATLNLTSRCNVDNFFSVESPCFINYSHLIVISLYFHW